MHKGQAIRYLRINHLLKHMHGPDVAKILNDLFSVIISRSSKIYTQVPKHAYTCRFSLDTDVKAFDCYVYDADTVFHLYRALSRVWPQGKVHDRMHQLSVVRPDFFGSRYRTDDRTCHKHIRVIIDQIDLVANRSNAEEILFWLDHGTADKFSHDAIVFICHRSYSAITPPNKLLQPLDAKRILQLILADKPRHFFAVEPRLHPRASDAETELVFACLNKPSQDPSWSIRKCNQMYIYELICGRRLVSKLEPADLLSQDPRHLAEPADLLSQDPRHLAEPADLLSQDPRHLAEPADLLSQDPRHLAEPADLRQQDPRHLAEPDFSLFYRLLQPDPSCEFIIDILFHELKNYVTSAFGKKRAIIDQMIDFANRVIVLNPAVSASVQFMLLLSMKICSFLMESKIHPVALFPHVLWINVPGSLCHTILPYLIGTDDYSINVLDYDEGYPWFAIRRLVSGDPADHLRFYGRYYDRATVNLLSRMCSYLRHPSRTHIRARFSVMSEIFGEIYRAVYE